MAVDFNLSGVFNLKPISLDAVRSDVNGLLINGETPVLAFQTMRDQLLFTNMRIISIDVQGITGKRKSYTSMPYSKIQYFAVQAPGFAELISNAELYLMFNNGKVATYNFQGAVDIGLIGRMISEYVLK